MGKSQLVQANRERERERGGLSEGREGVRQGERGGGGEVTAAAVAALGNRLPVYVSCVFVCKYTSTQNFMQCRGCI